MLVVAKPQHSESEVRCLLTVTKHTVYRHANELVHVMHLYLHVQIVYACVLFATIYNSASSTTIIQSAVDECKVVELSCCTHS